MDEPELFFRQILNSDLDEYANDPSNEIYKTALLKLKS